MSNCVSLCGGGASDYGFVHFEFSVNTENCKPA